MTEMPELEFAAERAKVRNVEDLRLLFQRCGWTQERIAAKEGKSQAWVSLIVRGRTKTIGRSKRKSQLGSTNNAGHTTTNNFRHKPDSATSKVTAACADRKWRTIIEITNETKLSYRLVASALKWIRATSRGQVRAAAGGAR
jgi:transcriptional regulator with XRE-family HTH domain